MARDEAYYALEKQINIWLSKNKGQSSKVKQLNWRGSRLSELPDVITNFRNLESLNISANNILFLPDWISQFSKLKTLDVSTNQLSKLPDSLCDLTAIESINCSGNRITELPDALDNLPNLVSLNFSNNGLMFIPPSLSTLKDIEFLYLSSNGIEIMPDFICSYPKIKLLDMSYCLLQEIPDCVGELKEVQSLDFSYNLLERLPDSIELLGGLISLDVSHNAIKEIPKSIGDLPSLKKINISHNRLEDLPASLANLSNFDDLNYAHNSYNQELAIAYRQGKEAVKAYLRAKAEGQIVLNEAKLIFVGEGEVGKTCLMDALLDLPWHKHDSTHGIQIKPIKVVSPETKKEIILNGWDFGGQRVYRPTHQLFFSAPAVYLVVWKPREGSQAGQVKEWIQLVKRREPSAKILVVATHGGPQQRQPDIDRQELWDLFGKDTVVDFFFVDSQPDVNGNRKGIEELKQAIASVAAQLPEVGRLAPKSFADVRKALQETGAAYLPSHEVLNTCYAHNMDDEIAKLFITISHRLGHLTHYENDPILRDIIILRPDWLATAMSYVLDDEETRAKHGLVNFSRLGRLWDNPACSAEERYPESLHPIFLRLMERFDLSYRVADPYGKNEADPISLIGQLVPDVRPFNLGDAWTVAPQPGDLQQTQICRIVDANNGQSANAEGLFYQLIVRLHKYSLGRVNYKDSVHWQRGLLLEDEYKSRAFLEHIGNDVRITVRSPFPEGLLSTLTREVKYLVESFWEGLRCDVMVPCIEPCGRNAPGTGMFNVNSLMESKREGEPKYPCPVCNKWQNIDSLLRNAPAAAEPISLDYLERKFAEVVSKMNYQGEKFMDRFDRVDDHDRRILSMVDKTYHDLLQVLTDEAKEGPRLFSFFPVDRSRFNPKEWIRTKFRLVLWCEHSRLPLPVLNGADSTKGVYDLDLDREWFKKSAPYLKFLIGTLGMVLPVASSSIKLALDETAYKLIEEQLDFGKSVIDAGIGETAKIGDFLGTADSTTLERGVATRADGSTLRELHALLKAKDPGFGGLVRVMNKRQEFLWVHEKFAGEY